MDNKKQIIDISWEVNNLLSQYIVVHDDVFKSSIRRIIPIPGIFKAINFGDHLTNVENIIIELKNCNIKIINFESAGAEKQYLNILLKYVYSLLITLSYFKVVLESLYEKSQSFIHTKYNWSQYKNDLAKYNQSVENYQFTGKTLNKAYQKIINE